MPALSSIFGHAKMTYRGTAARPAISECCVNRTLMPRWRGPQAMGDDNLAMGFVCHRCGREFLSSDVHNRRLIRGNAPASAAPAATPAHGEPIEPMEPAATETPEDGTADTEAEEPHS